MYRREFINFIGCAVLASQQLAFAQPSRSLRRIGVLMSVHSTDPEGQAQFAALVRGLADLGWSDGQNLQLVLRWGGSDVNQIRAFAKELVSLQPELIVAQGTPVTAAVQRETRTIPIVFVPATRSSMDSSVIRVDAISSRSFWPAPPAPTRRTASVQERSRRSRSCTRVHPLPPVLNFSPAVNLASSHRCGYRRWSIR